MLLPMFKMDLPTSADAVWKLLYRHGVSQVILGFVKLELNIRYLTGF